MYSYNMYIDTKHLVHNLGPDHLLFIIPNQHLARTT